MTFQTAKYKLKEIAKGRYHAVTYELVEHFDGTQKNECSGYIDGVGYRKGITWAEVILRFEQDVDGKAPDEEEMPQDDMEATI